MHTLTKKGWCPFNEAQAIGRFQGPVFLGLSAQQVTHTALKGHYPMEGIRQDAPVNDELRGFDPQDLEFLGPVHEAYTARTILIIVQKSAVSHLIFTHQSQTPLALVPAAGLVSRE